MKKTFRFIAMLGLFLAFGSMLHAQTKAKINIKRNQNGTQTEETKEVVIGEGADIQDILKEMGVLDELGQLKDGQQFEISIEKFDSLENRDEINLRFQGAPGFAPLPPMPPMPPMAPMPPMPPFPGSYSYTTEKKTYLGVMLKSAVETDGKNIDSGKPYVTEVIEESPALTAGIESGDIIMEIDNQEMNSLQEVIEYVQSKSPGDKIEVKVMRNGKKKTLKATLGEKEMPVSSFGYNNEERNLPEEFRNYNFNFDADSITISMPNSPDCGKCPDGSFRICQPFSWNNSGMSAIETAFLGVTPNNVEVITGDGTTIFMDEIESDSQEQNTGVKILVEKGTAAEKMGLQDGDVILEITGQKVNSFDELATVIGTCAPQQVVKIKYQREGKTRETEGPLGKRSVSSNEDFRIFHDYKGMDEGGNHTYEYEFDMDQEDVEQHMEELLQSLDEQQLQLQQEQERVREELERLRNSKSTINIKIEIEDISAEEAAAVNANANPKLSTDNSLVLDKIAFFPNPNNGLINLSFASADTSPFSINVYSSDGTTVYKEEVTNKSGSYNNQIDISSNSDGVYYLQISQSGRTYSKKIVKGN
jgi:membrane-associated protease RseP (regulator of RpoE activity)